MSINGHKTSCTRTMYLRKKEMKRYIISSLHPLKRNNTPPNTMIPKKLTLPLKVTTLISKTTPPFCHVCLRVECQVDISSVELASPSASLEASSSSPSSSSSSSNSKATREGGERLASRVKPPMDVCRHAIQPTWTFTWYNSVDSVSRRASMCCSYIMTSPKDTSPEEEEGANADGAEWKEGATESDYHDRNWASLHLTIA